MTRREELYYEWEASEEYETIAFHDWLVKHIAELEERLETEYRRGYDEGYESALK